MTTDRLRADAERAFQAAIAAVDPRVAVESELERRGSLGFGRIQLLAFGKAAVPMISAAVEALKNEVIAGTPLAVTNHRRATLVDGIRVMGAGHPVPDQFGLAATHEVVETCRSTSFDLLLVLISGGGSAMLPAPVGGVSLEDLAATTEVLLTSGVDITQMNTVRKHLSSLKGGGLAKLVSPTPVLALILSDVVGDDPGVIAGGTTAPDESTFQDAIDILTSTGYWEQIPLSVRDHLRSGVAERVPETPSSSDPVFGTVENVIVGNNRMSLRGAAALLETSGYRTATMGAPVIGDAAAAGRRWVSTTKRVHAPITAIVAGGETTVDVIGSGRGGRNQELALAFALGAQSSIDGDWVFLSAGTDGIDGPTEVAGALVDNSTIDRIRRNGGDPEALLGDNDSHAAMLHSGDLLVTGETGTNVGDVQIFLRPDLPRSGRRGRTSDQPQGSRS